MENNSKSSLTNEEYALHMKIEELRKDFQKFKEEFEGLAYLAQISPRNSLQNARIIAEQICKRIFTQEVSKNIDKNITLKPLIDGLAAKNILPNLILRHLRTVQEFTNFGSHDQGDEVPVSLDQIQPCIHSLLKIVEWYFTKYNNVPETHIDLKEVTEKYKSIIIGDSEAKTKESIDKTDDESHWKSVSSQNTIEAYKEYLSIPGGRKHVIEAIEKMEELQRLEVEEEEAWETAKQKDTSQAYKAYLSGSTIRTHSEEAAERLLALKREEDLDDRAWKKAYSSNTPESYREYVEGKTIKRHMDEANVKLATSANKNEENNLWLKAVKANTVEAYKEYIGQSKLKYYVDDAGKAILKLQLELQAKGEQKEDMLWKEAMGKDTVDGYESYIKISILKKHASEAQEAIKRLKAAQQSNMQQVLEGIDNLIWDGTIKQNTINGYESYLKRGTSRTHIAEAEEALKRLRKAEEDRRLKLEEEQRKKNQQALLEQEESLWSETLKKNTVSGYESYLKTSTLKKHVLEADEAAKRLKKAEEEKNAKKDVVILKDQNGRDIEFRYLDTIIRKGIEYVVLTPAANKNNDSAEVVILRAEKRKEGVEFSPIANNRILKEVFQEFRKKNKI